MSCTAIIVQDVSVAVFTAEFCLRLWSCKNRATFMKTPLNLVDLLSVLPYYIEVLLPVHREVWCADDCVTGVCVCRCHWECM